MRAKLLPFYFPVLFSVLFNSFAIAQDRRDSVAQNDIFTMGLEDLMKIQVVTASKSGESRQDAPAIISVITAKDIEAYGAMSVSEVLDRLAGTYITNTYYFSSSLSVRGDFPGIYNAHVLYLLNGRPMRESMHNAVNINILTVMPVNSIERIEIIKGPGSVLYGTSAYVGVINIITKEASQNSVAASVRYGSFNTLQANVSATKKIKELEILTAVNYIKSNGWDYTARAENSVIPNKSNTADSLLNPKTIKMSKQGIGAVLQATYKGFKLNTSYSSFDNPLMNRVSQWRTPLDYNIGINLGFADLGYTHTFSKMYTSSVNVTYNHLNYKNYIPLDQYKDVNARFLSNDVLAEWTNYLHPTEKLNAVIGVLMNTQTGKVILPELNTDLSSYDLTTGINPDPYIGMPLYNQTWFSSYVQADYTFAPFFKLVAGGQINKVTGLSANFVPRLGGIVTINNVWSAKVLYGQAFRSAAFYEKQVRSLPAVVGNANLKPETVGTFEAQINYNTSKLSFSATYFRSQQHNLIRRSNSKDSLYLITYKGVAKTSVPQYINQGSLMSEGIELEANAYLGKYFSTMGSVSYQTNKDDKGRSDVYGMPKLMVKVGVQYKSKQGIGLGIFNSYFGTGGDITTYDNKGKAITKEVNPAAIAYQFLTANLNIDLLKLTQYKSSKSLMINVYGVNLFNAQVYTPEVQRRNINTVPGRAPLAVYASFAFGF